MREKIILIGGGGHCKSCIDVIEQGDKFKIIGIIDIAEKVGESIFGYKIIGTDNDIPKFVKNYRNFLITIGQIHSPDIRIKLFNIIKELGGHFPIIISPSAYVSQHSKLHEGTIVMHHAIVNAGAVVGVNCIINTKALIEHDAIIGNHCHMSTASTINGGVKVGNCSFYGSEAVSKQDIIIPNNSFIKANSIVK